MQLLQPGGRRGGGGPRGRRGLPVLPRASGCGGAGGGRGLDLAGGRDAAAAAAAGGGRRRPAGLGLQRGGLGGCPRLGGGGDVVDVHAAPTTGGISTPGEICMHTNRATLTALGFGSLLNDVRLSQISLHLFT